MDAKFTAERVDYACRSHLFDLIAEAAVVFDERFASCIKLLTVISQHNPILLAKFASDGMASYSLFETGIRKCDPERALVKAKTLFDLAIVFKRVKKHLAIRNHHTIELLLVCAPAYSEDEAWVLDELAKLPSREQNLIQMTRGKIF
jgi:hypothetical protein